jgi:predicted membrane protein
MPIVIFIISSIAYLMFICQKDIVSVIPVVLMWAASFTMVLETRYIHAMFATLSSAYLLIFILMYAPLSHHYLLLFLISTIFAVYAIFEIIYEKVKSAKRRVNKRKHRRR